MTDNCFKLGVKEMKHRDSRREGLSRMADGLCKETESSVQPRRTGQQNTLGESGLKKTFKATDVKGMTFSVLRGDVEIKKKAEGGEGMSESL